jgi:inositol polyphosphate 5-phosphatase INPP5B/F
VNSPAPIFFTFVNAHLAAFDEMAEKRNTDFHDLSKKLSFDSDGIPPQPSGSEEEDTSERANLTGTEPNLPPLSIYETDILFWMVSCFLMEIIMITNRVLHREVRMCLYAYRCSLINNN